MTNRILDVQNLHTRYHTYGGYAKVVNGVNLYVNQGEKIGLVGETGCGKTTTARAVMRILPQANTHIPKGRILYHGKDILQMSEKELVEVRTKGISMIFQEPSAALNPVFKVGTQMADVIKSSSLYKKTSKEEIKQIAMKAIKEVYIPDPERILDNYPNQLSGGMKQRICIAMSIVIYRELLIADEPGTALDVTIQDQVHKLLRGLVADKGMSLIMITHSLGVARELTDRIYVMYAGNIVETAATKDLFKNPIHPYTLGLLGSVPKLTGGGMTEGIYGSIPDYINPPLGCRFYPRCPKAMELCKNEMPQAVEVQSEHFVSCFAAGGDR